MSRSRKSAEGPVRLTIAMAGLAIAVVLATLTPFEAVSKEMDVPAKLQAALFKKIFAYDRTLKGLQVKTLVFFGKEYEKQATELLTAFGDVGLSASLVPVDQFSRVALDSSSVVYVLADTVPEPLKAQCEKVKAMSVSGFASLAENAEVAIAVGQKADGRPEIVVAKARLKTEGHELSAALLGLARVVE